MSQEKYKVIDVSECEKAGRDKRGVRPKYWRIVDGRKALVKKNGGARDSYYSNGLPEDNMTEDVLEKIAYEVGKLLEIKCAEIELGIDKGRYATISYDYLEENEKPIYGDKIIDNDYPDDGDVCKKLFGEVFSGLEKNLEGANVEKLKSDFFNMVLFDCLMSNADERLDSWGVKLNKNGEYEFIPIFDYDLIFLEKHCKYFNGLEIGSSANLADYMRKNYYKETYELVKKINERITTKNIEKILNGFDDGRDIDKAHILNCIMRGKELIVSKYKVTDRFITNLPTIMADRTKEPEIPSIGR